MREVEVKKEVAIEKETLYESEIEVEMLRVDVDILKAEQKNALQAKEATT
jgi:hypothetical protein